MSRLWSLSKPDLLKIAPSAFAVHRRISTRWRDNDAYGHVNNSVYYEYFDSAINRWLSEEIPADLTSYRRFVAESGCKYLREIAYPADLHLGMNVVHVGTSRVTYEVAIFALTGETPGPINALGHWTHVYVSADTRSPVSIPSPTRELLTRTKAVQIGEDHASPDTQIDPLLPLKIRA
jgi:acyl-CoA thioester hydrolase